MTSLSAILAAIEASTEKIKTLEADLFRLIPRLRPISGQHLHQTFGAVAEEVYLRDYRLPPEAQAGIGRWFQFYNQ